MKTIDRMTVDAALARQFRERQRMADDHASQRATWAGLSDQAWQYEAYKHITAVADLEKKHRGELIALGFEPHRIAVR